VLRLLGLIIHAARGHGAHLPEKERKAHGSDISLFFLSALQIIFFVLKESSSMVGPTLNILSDAMNDGRCITV
jgi:hypothetical protein